MNTSPTRLLIGLLCITVLVSFLTAIAVNSIHGKVGGAATTTGFTGFDGIDVISGLSQNNSLVLDATGDFVANSIQFGTSIVRMTAGSTSTLSAAQECASQIEVSPTVANSSTTLATSTQVQTACMPNLGSIHQVAIRNTSVAASTTILVTGASTTIRYASSTGVVSPLIIPGQSTLILTLMNATTTQSAGNMIEAYAQLYK